MPANDIPQSGREESESTGNRTGLHDAGFSFPVQTDPLGKTRRAIIVAAQLEQRGISYPHLCWSEMTVGFAALWVGFAVGVQQEIAAAIELAVSK